MCFSSVRTCSSALALLVLFFLIAPLGASAFERAERQDNFLDSQSRFEQTWQELLKALPEGAKFHSIRIEDRRIGAQISTDGVRLQAVDAGYERVLNIVDRVLVSPPTPVSTVEVGFAETLFTPDDIAWRQIHEIVDAAIARAGLEDPSRVSSVEIAPAPIVLPRPGFGRLRMMLYVTSGYESATIVADPQGAIISADISNTRRAAKLDLLAQDDWPMAEAQDLLAIAAGSNAVIREVSVSRKSVSLTRDNPTSPAAADYVTWDLSGARVNGIPTLNPARAREFLPFALDDVDLGQLPQIKKAALSAFATAGVVITDITARKNLAPGGLAASEVLWTVKAQFPNAPASRFGIFPELDELGVAIVRTDGTLVQVTLPKRLRQPVNWLGAEGMVLTLNAIRDAYGREAKIQEISMDEDGGVIYMENHDEPGKTVTLVYSDEGLKLGLIQSGSRTSLQDAFTVADLEGYGIERLQDVFKEAVEHVGAGGAKAEDINVYMVRLYGSNGQKTPSGTPQLEIRAWGSDDWITYRFATGEFVAGPEQMRTF